MKTERHYSFRMLSFVMALLMLLSSMPTRTAAADWQSGNIVITNPGNDQGNELIVNASGKSDDPIMLSVGDNTATFTASSGRIYYKFVAPTNGTVTFTFSADQNWDFLYYKNSSSSERIRNNPQIDPVKLDQNQYVMFGLLHYPLWCFIRQFCLRSAFWR